MTQPRTPIAKLLFLFTALLTLTGSLSAATINVPADQGTIQAAINAAVSGQDEVVVSPGTYLEAINFNGKAITLRSVSGDPADTIIDGGGSGTVVTCDSGETSTTVLDGFTITNGSGFGGGMYNFNSNPTVSNCTFSGNSASYGGGMNNFNSSPTVSNCTFSGNSASYGGGMYNEDNSSPTVSHCTFSGNTANDGGGGMSNEYNSNPTVSNCTFSGNTADYGGGMENGSSSSPTVTNCTFSGNTSGNGGGMFNKNGSSPTVSNCILWGDSPDEIFNNASAPTVSFSDVQGGLPANTVDGGGNIDADPLFVDADGADNTAGTEDDDLRLSGGSPCIDAGDSTGVSSNTDHDGNLRGVDDPATADTGASAFGVVVDMGAYEFQTGPCISQLEGDINCDGIVNLLDLALLALHWLETI